MESNNSIYHGYASLISEQSQLSQPKKLLSNQVSWDCSWQRGATHKQSKSTKKHLLLVRLLLNSLCRSSICQNVRSCCIRPSLWHVLSHFFCDLYCIFMVTTMKIMCPNFLRQLSETQALAPNHFVQIFFRKLSKLWRKKMRISHDPHLSRRHVTFKLLLPITSTVAGCSTGLFSAAKLFHKFSPPGVFCSRRVCRIIMTLYIIGPTVCGTMTSYLTSANET